LASSLLHRYDLRRAQKRQHIVEGLLRALAELDRVVSAVRAAKDGAAASAELQAQFGLSAEQVQRLIPVV
jgi:DNA gyrase/topoisomerase IV subunit A